MKRKILGTAAFAAMIAFTSVSAYAAETVVRGDADQSGTVDLLDAVTVMNYTEGNTEIANLSYSDVNNDGSVDEIDAAYILKSVSGTAVIPDAITHEIVLNDTGITVDGSAENSVYAQIDNNAVTIISPGTYSISGELTDGQVIIDIPSSYTNNNVELELNGVTVTNSSGPAIYGLNGDLKISAKKGTVNTLSDGTPSVFETETAEDGTVTTTDEPDACIFSHDGISLKGKGELVINGNYANGISGKDEVEIKNLTLTVNAVDNAIKGKDYVTVSSGTLDLTSEKGDGIRCTKGDITVEDGSITVNAQDNGLFTKVGNIIISGGTLNVTTVPDGTADTETYNYDGIHTKAGTIDISGGSITVKSYCDGIQAAGNISINGAAVIDVTTTGTITSSSSGSQSGPGGQGGPGSSGGFSGYTNNTTADISAKGIKSDTNLTIGGGAQITANTTDDSLHANGSITIDTAIINVSAGDDGVHADDTLTINDGCELTVAKSYEGIEAETIVINGGTTVVYADDDMVNAAGGADGSSSGGFGNVSSGSGCIYISGGYLYCVNTKDGDGIDSNGNIEMNGGTVIVNGVSGNTSNSSIDFDGTFAYNGGTLFAVGGGGNMAQSITENSSSAYVLTYGFGSQGGNQSGPGGSRSGGPGSQSGSSSSSISAGTQLTLTDSSGNVIMTLKPVNAVENIVIGSSDLNRGSTYKLYSGGTYSGTLDDRGYSTGGTISGGSSLGSATISSKITNIR